MHLDILAVAILLVFV
uniref:Uncharacterized protein n=1 Tax=Anguilla anguilla TaxID=7936 RepID=A0A0E9S1X5_ANGAN